MFGVLNRYRNYKAFEKYAQSVNNGLSKSDRIKWRLPSETPNYLGGVWGFRESENIGSLVYKSDDGNFYSLTQRADLPRIKMDINKWRYSNY